MSIPFETDWNRQRVCGNLFWASRPPEASSYQGRIKPTRQKHSFDWLNRTGSKNLRISKKGIDLKSRSLQVSGQTFNEKTQESFL